MINNQVNLIGLALTNFVSNNLTSSNNTFYTLKIEVENSSGKTSEYNIMFFTKNSRIDFTQKLEGHLIAITGFLYVSTSQNSKYPSIKVVGQYINVLDTMLRPVRNEVRSQDRAFRQVNSSNAAPQEMEINEDDLPF